MKNERCSKVNLQIKAYLKAITSNVKAFKLIIYHKSKEYWSPASNGIPVTVATVSK